VHWFGNIRPGIACRKSSVCRSNGARSRIEEFSGIRIWETHQQNQKRLRWCSAAAEFDKAMIPDCCNKHPTANPPRRSGLPSFAADPK
jgi:hypothetical protein